jgi:hypothetical protein
LDELPDVNLSAGASSEFRRGDGLAADIVRDVGLTAVGAHFCWDGLQD